MRLLDQKSSLQVDRNEESQLVVQFLEFLVSHPELLAQRLPIFVALLSCIYGLFLSVVREPWRLKHQPMNIDLKRIPILKNPSL